MRHLVSGRKFNRTKSHREAMFKNMATSLFEHKKLHTTEAKAKELRAYAETLITKAKHALAREKQNLLPAGQTVDIHNRRIVARAIRNKAVLQELFDAIAPAVESRNGGYTRVIKTGTRRGDAGRTAIIELVDWSAPQDGTVSNKPAKKKAVKNKSKKIQEKSSVKTNEEINKVVTVEKEEEKEKVVESAAIVENVESKDNAETLFTEDTSVSDEDAAVEENLD